MVSVSKSNQILLKNFDSHLSLANSISFKKNNLLVTLGCNKILLLDYDKLAILKQMGNLGLSETLFREPVYGMYDSEIYICDWHNNRIVIFDEEFNYTSEIGSSGYSVRTTNILTLMLRVVKYIVKMSFKGSYFKSHFQSQIN